MFCLAEVISLMKVLEVERSGLCLLENSIVTTFMFVHCVHKLFLSCLLLLVYLCNKLVVFSGVVVGVAFVYRFQ